MGRHQQNQTRPAPHVARDLVQWRNARLVQAGFDDALASELAAHGGYDLHELLGLIDRGCPPPLAARILAPI